MTPLGAPPPEADNTFCENMLFCHGFKNDSNICIHWLQVFNMKWKENQSGGRKEVAQATMLAHWAQVDGRLSGGKKEVTAQ